MDCADRLDDRLAGRQAVVAEGAEGTAGGGHRVIDGGVDAVTQLGLGRRRELGPGLEAGARVRRSAVARRLRTRSMICAISRSSMGCSRSWSLERDYLR